jgi:uncharacterized OsmC-like protein
MSQKITVRYAPGKLLRGAARHHVVVTDRPLPEGGTDTGCTSGELLLLAIGSCAAGGLRSYLEAQRLPCDSLSVDVFFEPHDDPGRRDRIVISVNLDNVARNADPAAMRTAATTGGVTGRIGLGSELVVRIPSLEG